MWPKTDKSIGLQAYKKLAMQWHPDKFQDEEDKKKAEKKFMDIAAAKEVLTDEGWLFLKSQAPT